jgi:predicted nicotinamide N-methyase
MGDSAIHVVMCLSTAHVPQETLHAAQQHVEEVARELGKVDRQSSFWASLRESGLSLEVLEWKFRFDVAGDALVLAQVDPVPTQTPGA